MPQISPEPEARTLSSSKKEEPKREEFAKIHFAVEHKHVGAGHAVFVVGSVPELGEWDVQGALRLTEKELTVPLWTGTVTQVSAGNVRFKFVTLAKDRNGQISWEEIDGDREIDVKPGSEMLIETGWGDPKQKVVDSTGMTQLIPGLSGKPSSSTIKNMAGPGMQNLNPVPPPVVTPQPEEEEGPYEGLGKQEIPGGIGWEMQNPQPPQAERPEPEPPQEGVGESTQEIPGAVGYQGKPEQQQQEPQIEQQADSGKPDRWSTQEIPGGKGWESKVGSVPPREDVSDVRAEDAADVFEGINGAGDFEPPHWDEQSDFPADPEPNFRETPSVVGPFSV